MAVRDSPVRPEPGLSLPVLDRLAPPPPADLVAARIEAHSAPGDVVLDLHARGGWIARAAIGGQRRAVSLESSPLTRLLAELVLRPPDIRHLDAAFQSLGASPRGDTSLRLSIGATFATRCATCGRSLIADEIAWETDGEPGSAGGEAGATPVRKHYRCTVCRDQRGGGDQRQAPLDQADVVRAEWHHDADAIRAGLRDRFAVPRGHEDLVEQLLDLHSPRQLAGFAAILGRIEGDLRAEPIEAALRLAFAHAVLPASRLRGHQGRVAALRITGGRVRRADATQWRERNPWLAFEDGFRLVRSFVQRLEGGPQGPVLARFGEDVRSLGETAATAVVRLATPTSLGALELEGRDTARAATRPRVRLILGQPPLRPTQDRLALAFFTTAWALGGEAAAALPIEPLLAASWRTPWGWQAAALRRSLEAAEPILARDGRVVYLLDDGGPEGLVAAVLGGVGAGYRLVEARLGDPDEERGGVVALVPPGATVPPGPRTRANIALPPVPGGAGDPDLVPGRSLFAAPERFDARPFSEADAGRAITDVAVDLLRARGEPARTERLFGEILIGLDRAGLLRRLLAAEPVPDVEPPSGPGPARARELAPAPEPPTSHVVRSAGGGARTSTPVERDEPRADPVERLVALIRDELGRPGRRRLTEIEPGRWWLADRDDVASAAVPLADRVEWAVYSLLSTAGPLSEHAFFERIATLFGGHDLPDETLVRSCLESYRSRASTPERLVTNDALVRRTAEHGELLALLADGARRLGMHLWLARREQARVIDGRPLGDRLADAELEPYFPVIARGPGEDLEAVDCIWYVKGRAALLFEVEWTAMIGELLLRRHARIAQDERIVRFLVVPDERTELVRHKLDRSPLLRRAMEEGNWHVLKWAHLRAFLARDPLSLDDLEPFLGLDPVVERSAEQLPLFDGG